MSEQTKHDGRRLRGKARWRVTFVDEHGKERSRGFYAEESAVAEEQWRVEHGYSDVVLWEIETSASGATLGQAD